MPALDSGSWAVGTPQGHKSLCVSAGRSGVLTGTLTPGTGPQCALPPCPLEASYLTGAERAEWVIVGRPASPMGALLPLEEAGIGVSGSPGAAGFGGCWGVRAKHSRQCRHRSCCYIGCCYIGSPSLLGPLGATLGQAQASHLTLIGDVHLGGKASSGSARAPSRVSTSSSQPSSQL